MTSAGELLLSIFLVPSSCLNSAAPSRWYSEAWHGQIEKTRNSHWGLHKFPQFQTAGLLFLLACLCYYMVWVTTTATRRVGVILLMTVRDEGLSTADSMRSPWAEWYQVKEKKKVSLSKDVRIETMPHNESQGTHPHILCSIICFWLHQDQTWIDANQILQCSRQVHPSTLLTFPVAVIFQVDLFIG